MSYLNLPKPCGKQWKPCACLNTTRGLFERFHCLPPTMTMRTRYLRMIPPVLMRVGELRGLIYRSERGQCGSPRTFIHFLRTPAMLACDPKGKQLYVLGGRYRITRKGIEG